MYTTPPRIKMVHVIKFNQLIEFQAVMFVLKEVHRLRGIKDGVKIASSIYSGNWFVAILIGCVRGKTFFSSG